jgi:hypothetical protein
LISQALFDDWQGDAHTKDVLVTSQAALIFAISMYWHGFTALSPGLHTIHLSLSIYRYLRSLVDTDFSVNPTLAPTLAQLILRPFGFSALNALDQVIG